MFQEILYLFFPLTKREKQEALLISSILSPQKLRSPSFPAFYSEQASASWLTESVWLGICIPWVKAEVRWRIHIIEDGAGPLVRHLQLFLHEMELEGLSTVSWKLGIPVWYLKKKKRPWFLRVNQLVSCSYTGVICLVINSLSEISPETVWCLLNEDGLLFFYLKSWRPVESWYSLSTRFCIQYCAGIVTLSPLN